MREGDGQGRPGGPEGGAGGRPPCEPSARRRWTRGRIDFLVDLAAFVSLWLLTTSGALLSWVLPPGSGGRGGGPLRLVWGLSRHEWGDVHFWLAVALVGLVVLHLVRHASWIVGMVRGPRSLEGGRRRLVLGAGLLAGLLLLGALPLLGEVEERPGREPGASIPDAAEREHGSGGGGHLRGRHTVREAARILGRSVSELLMELGLPAATPPGARLGRLLRRHGKDLHELRDRPAPRPGP